MRKTDTIHAELKDDTYYNEEREGTEVCFDLRPFSASLVNRHCDTLCSTIRTLTWHFAGALSS